MKKTSLILILCMLLSLLTSCGGSGETTDTTSPAVFVTVPALEGTAVQVDTSTMTHYTLDCGLSFYGPGGLEAKDIDDMAAYMDSGFFLFMVIEEPKEGTILADIDLEGYAKMLTEQNGLDPCVTDRYGSLATTYVADSYDGETAFFYYMTVKETAESFWMVQMVCPGDLAEKHVDSIAQWSSTVMETPPAE